MTKRIAIWGLLVVSCPTTAFAQFSAAGDTDLTATGGGGTAAVSEDVGGTGHPGRFGIGITNHARGAARNVTSLVPFNGAGPGVGLSQLGIGSASAKYFLTDRIAAQILLGFGILSGTYYPDPLNDRDNKIESSGIVLTAGPRVVYSALRGENAELYIGGGLDVLYEDNTGDPPGADNAFGWSAMAFVVSVPVGFEVGFPGIPALRLSAEVSLSYVSASYEFHQDTGADVDSDEVATASAFILGSPGLDFLTLGIHYYF